MRRGTTPTISIGVKGIAVDDIKNWYITLAQGNYILTLENDRISFKDGKLLIPLEEEETLGFRDGLISVQIRAVTKDGDRIASDIKSDTIEGLLWDEVI